jgi:hypothetical protein
VWAHSAPRFFRADSLASRPFIQLVFPDPSYAKVVCGGVINQHTADRGGGYHHGRFAQFKAAASGIEQGKGKPLLLVVGADGVAENGADAAGLAGEIFWLEAGLNIGGESIGKGVCQSCKQNGAVIIALPLKYCLCFLQAKARAEGEKAQPVYAAPFPAGGLCRAVPPVQRLKKIRQTGVIRTRPLFFLISEEAKPCNFFGVCGQDNIVPIGGGRKDADNAPEV